MPNTADQRKLQAEDAEIAAHLARKGVRKMPARAAAGLGPSRFAPSLWRDSSFSSAGGPFPERARTMPGRLRDKGE